jgi:hypothetical protein
MTARARLTASAWFARLGWTAFRPSQVLRRQRGRHAPVESLEARVVLAASILDRPEFGWTPIDVNAVPGALQPSGGTGDSSADPQSAPPFPLSDTFSLASRPSANHTIYLDFTGHTTTGTNWNLAFNTATFVTDPYSLDADIANFSNLELENIQRIWQIVVEDMSPFDVNVTTIDPGIERLRNTGGGDTQWGMRAIVGNGGPAFDRAGGIAFLNSFDGAVDVGCFNYPANRGNTNLSIANTISHEVGHTFGLQHDGLTNPVQGYYDGHGSGPTAWGPIMGSGFGPPFDQYRVFQWSRGEYQNADQLEDDLNIITTQNGFTYRVDDYGNTTATANLLTPAATPVVVGNGVEILRTGVIERTSDFDFFRLNTSGGLVTVDLTNLSDSPNLDAELQILDSTGTLLTTVNPASALNASYSATLATGTYYLRIDGVGFGDPVTNGYSDYGSLGQYSLRVVAPLNNRPVVDPKTFSLDENAANGTVVGTATATDPDGNTITYSITGGNTGNAFQIDPVTGVITVSTSSAVDFENTPIFNLTVTATDNGFPPAAGTGTVTINLNNLNEPPTGVTLTPSSVNEGIPIGAVVGQLAGLDPDSGDTVTFALTDGINARDNARFEIVGTQLRMREVLNFEATPIAFIMVRVTDAAGRSFDATLQITINNINEAPTDILLSSATIAENVAASLGSPAFVGTFSAVDEDFNQTYTYSLVTGTGDTNNTEFEITPSGQLSATRSFNFETEPTRSIRVRVTDNGSPAQSFEKVFTITVTNVNEAPSAPTLSNSTVVEGVANITVGMLSAVDPEGNSGLTFSLAPLMFDNSLFVIEGNVLKVGAAPLDFEAAATRTVRVLVFDGLNSQTANLVINVLNVDDTATMIDDLSDSTIDENAGANAVVGGLSTTGGTGPYTYSLVTTGTPGDGSLDNAAFDIVGTNLVARSSFNFETKNEYFVRVRSTPTVGSPVERAFRVTVLNVNEAPTDIQLSGSSIPENADAGFVVATLTATDPDAGTTFTFSLPAGVDNNDEFTLVGTGFNNLRTTRSYDFETVTSRTITLRVTDNGSPARSFDKQVVLQITNRNEPPTAINFATGGTVFENQPGALVGTITTNDPDVGETFTYRLFPRDLVLNPDLKDDSYLFQVIGNQVFVGPTRLDYEAIQPDLLDGNKRNLTIWVRATDSGGNPIEKPVKITVLNLNDRPQEVGLTGGTVTENVATSNRIVGTFASTDADIGAGSYTYQLVSGDGSADNALFFISGDQLRTSSVFNFEARQAYSIRVRTTDSGGLSAERVFTIRVIDVDELPTGLAFSGVTVPENKSAGTLAGVLAATDPEGGPITFTLTPPSAADSNALFRIEGNIVRTTGPLDFELARTHTIRVQATDASGQSIVRDFVVTVSDESNPSRFYRAYNRRGEYHFYTTSQAEFEAVLRNPGFRDETTSQSGFNVISDPTPGASPIYRIFNFQTQRHYYTTNAAERDFLLGLVTPSNPLYGQIGWRYEKDEGLIFANQAPGTVPIYRLYNRPTGVHLYTESAAVRDAVLRQFPGIWEAHGILGYAYPVVVTAPTAVPATAAATSEPVVSQAVSSVTTLVGPAFSSTSSTSTSTTTSGTASRLETLVQSSAVHAAPVAAAATATVNDDEADPLPVAVATPVSTSALDDLFASPSSLVGLPGLGD